MGVCRYTSGFQGVCLPEPLPDETSACLDGWVGVTCRTREVRITCPAAGSAPGELVRWIPTAAPTVPVGGIPDRGQQSSLQGFAPGDPYYVYDSRLHVPGAASFTQARLENDCSTPGRVPSETLARAPPL